MDSLGTMILGAVVLVGLVAFVLSRTNWRAYQIVVSVLVLFASAAFVVFAARTLATHRAWATAVAAYETRIKDVEKHLKLVSDAAREEAEAAGVDSASLAVLRTEIATARLGRGRWWRAQKVIGALAGGLIRADIELAAPAEGATEAPKPPVEGKSSVFVFEEAAYPAGKYLGEFQVTTVTGNRLEMAVAPPVMQADIERIAASPGPWLIFEVMPADEHDVLVELPSERRQQLFPAATLGEEVAKAYEQDMQVVDESTPDGPNIWMRVKFLKPYESTDPVSQEKTQVAAGAEGLFDPESAAALIANGTAEKVARVFVRPLRNYTIEFRDQYSRQLRLRQEEAELARTTAIYNAAADRAKADTVVHEEDVARMKADVARLEAETAIIARYLETTQKQVDAMRKEIDALAADNQRIAMEIGAGGSPPPALAPTAQIDRR